MEVTKGWGAELLVVDFAADFAYKYLGKPESPCGSETWMPGPAAPVEKR